MADEIRRITDAPDIVKRAVKEALDDKRMEDLATQLTNISNQMSAGFSAVHARQDTANGKLMKHELDITTLKTQSSGSNVYTNVLWFLVTVLVGLVTFLMTHK